MVSSQLPNPLRGRRYLTIKVFQDKEVDKVPQLSEITYSYLLFLPRSTFIILITSLELRPYILQYYM